MNVNASLSTPRVRPRNGALAFAALALLIESPAIRAEGFRNPAPGVFGLARSGGRFAQVQDATSVTHNPANLVEIPSAEILFTPTFIHIETDFDLATGEKARTENPWKVLPNLYAAMPLKDGKYAIGLGVTTPYGISNEWENYGAFAPGGSLRYAQPHYSELATVNFNPTFAMKINDAVQFGVGLDVMWGSFELRSHLPPIGGPSEGKVEFEGDGVGLGFNTGLTFKLGERHRAAFTFRSPIEIEFEGDTKVSNFPIAAPRSDFETEIEFPTIIGFGYGIQLTDKIQLEANLEYLEFSNFDKLKLDTGANAALFPPSVPQKWEDTFTCGLAADWRINGQWNLMGSYHFFESPVPQSTLSPTIPDANQHALTAGAAYNIGRHGLGLAYSYVFYKERDVSSNISLGPLGKYDTAVHLIALNYRFRF